MDTDDGNQDDVRDLSDEAAIRRMGDLRERQTNTENIPAENAIIEEIICTNFMCHAHLQIKVGPLINFIIGHNGSGKSAVLSALTVCLGGKATATNRSQSLKGFIKEGCEASTLSVRIKNQGVSSYKQDVYGASIIVERHFSRSGASGFKIKNANGKIITTKKSDLDDILDFYALQLDNPMNVLTQDMARQFLNSSSSQDKYKFFHRGTQLETLDNDYQEIERTLDTIQPKMRHIQEQKAATKAAYDRARKAAELVAGQQRTVNAIKRLEWEMAWAQVEEQENILEDADNEIKELDVTMEEQKEKANDMERKFSHAEQSVEQATGAIASLEAELQPHQEKKTEVTTIFQAQVDELQGLIHQQREIRTELKVAQSDVQKYTGLIQAEEEKLRNADDGRPAQIHAEIQECKSTLEEANQAKDSIDSQGRDLKQDAEGAQNQKKRAAQTAQEISDDFQKQNRRIKEVEKENGKINLHPNIQRLMTAITRDSRFRVKPVGPVSQHVHLLKPEWSSILERQAGMMLDAFCVTSKADEAILTELLRRHEW
jgi:chromosome segregation ATPase